MATPLITCFPCDPLHTNAYLVAATREAWAVDPGSGSASKLMEEAKERDVRITRIINTHGHWDHIVDNAALHDATGAPIFIHSADEQMIRNPQSIMHLDFKIPPSFAESHLKDGQELTLGKHTFTVLHTPGHTPGGICLFSEKHHILLSGDTLFADTYGRTDLPGGSSTDMVKSLTRLAALPKDTILYPGHGPQSTIGKERWLQWVAKEKALP